MQPLTPLLFRPSLSQRAVAALLCAGSWLVGARCLTLLIEHLPRLRGLLRAAETATEPTALLWVQIFALLVAAVLGGAILASSTLGLVLVEGSLVLADELGISVELGALPGPLARWLGAGRLPWKHITRLERKGPFFVLKGHSRKPGESGPDDPTLKFLMVEELERLILLILERSSNLRFEESGD